MSMYMCISPFISVIFWCSCFNTCVYYTHKSKVCMSSGELKFLSYDQILFISSNTYFFMCCRVYFVCYYLVYTNFFFLLVYIGEGNGNPLQYSCLENPRDRGAWWAAVYWVTQSRTQLKQLSSKLLAIWSSLE